MKFSELKVGQEFKFNPEDSCVYRRIGNPGCNERWLYITTDWATAERSVPHDPVFTLQTVKKTEKKWVEVAFRKITPGTVFKWEGFTYTRCNTLAEMPQYHLVNGHHEQKHFITYFFSDFNDTCLVEEEVTTETQEWV